MIRTPILQYVGTTKEIHSSIHETSISVVEAQHSDTQRHVGLPFLKVVLLNSGTYQTCQLLDLLQVEQSSVFPNLFSSVRLAGIPYSIVPP